MTAKVLAFILILSTTLGVSAQQVGQNTSGTQGTPTFQVTSQLVVETVVVTDKNGAAIEGPEWRLEAIHTPGHASDHLCFALPGTGLLFSGDHVMGWSTSVIACTSQTRTHSPQPAHSAVTSIVRLGNRSTASQNACGPRDNGD